jgi:hypothetical protein
MVSDVGQHQMFTCPYSNLILQKVTLLLEFRNNGICTACSYRLKWECQTEKWWQLLVMVDSNDNSRVRNYFQTKCQ